MITPSPLMVPIYGGREERALKQQQITLARWLRVLIMIEIASCGFIFTIPGAVFNILIGCLALYGVNRFSRGLIRTYYILYTIVAAGYILCLLVCLSTLR